jgi:YVTN family beta-propeller protein
VAAIDVPGEPHGLALSPDGQLAYVVQRKLNQLAIIDTASRQITKTAPAEKRPDMIAVSPDGQTLYVTSRDDNKLLVVSANDLQITAQADTGDEPHGVAYRK